MDFKNNLEHPFFTLEQLVAKLTDKGLIIVDKSKFIWYLKSFNCQNIVNEYNKAFLTNNNYRQYLPNANSQMIVDLFNFNRSISNILIGDLHSIEMQLASSMEYELMEIIDQLYPSRTAFSALSIEEKMWIFNCKNEDEFDELSSELQHNFEELKYNKEYIYKGWEKWEEVPLYSLSLLWTFGLTIKLFCNLNKIIQQKILIKYFNKIKDIDLKTFECLLYCLKDLRNKISHNEVVYKFKFESINLISRIIEFNRSSRANKVKKILQKDFIKLLNIENKDFSKLDVNLKLLHIVEIITKITNNHELKRLINEKVVTLRKAIKDGYAKGNIEKTKYEPCEQAWKNICSFLGYDDN